MVSLIRWCTCVCLCVYGRQVCDGVLAWLVRSLVGFWRIFFIERNVAVDGGVLRFRSSFGEKGFWRAEPSRG